MPAFSRRSRGATVSQPIAARGGITPGHVDAEETAPLRVFGERAAGGNHRDRGSPVRRLRRRGECLLGVSRVADGDRESPRAAPTRRRVPSYRLDRHRRVVSGRGPNDFAADGGAAHAQNHRVPKGSLRHGAVRKCAERVADLVRQIANPLVHPLPVEPVAEFHPPSHRVVSWDRSSSSCT